MFDFQKLEVYNRAKAFCLDIGILIAKNKFDYTTNDQLRRASFSIMLNIAEGTSRFGNKDKRYFMIISRGSVFECIAILEYLKDNHEISAEIYHKYYAELEELSKMLYAFIRKLES